MTVLREQQQRAAASEDLFPRISRAQRDCASAGAGPSGSGFGGLLLCMFCLGLFGVVCGEKGSFTQREGEGYAQSGSCQFSKINRMCVEGKKGWSRVEAAREAAGCDQKTQGPGDRSGRGLWGW